jgi:hypothetical protein
MSNNVLKHMHVFDEISMNNLSPNQYYLLCCIYNSITPLKINIHLELRYLKSESWVTGDNKLTSKATELIIKLESYFSAQSKKKNVAKMGNNFKENIMKYREMFPNIKLPNGKAARSSPGNLENAFNWFFDKYKYSWDTIFKATTAYINEYQNNNYKFMRTSHYFIKKNNVSDLADWCDNIDDGVETVSHNPISIKVV